MNRCQWKYIRNHGDAQTCTELREDVLSCIAGVVRADIDCDLTCWNITSSASFNFSKMWLN